MAITVGMVCTGAENGGGGGRTDAVAALARQVVHVVGKVVRHHQGALEQMRHHHQHLHLSDIETSPQVAGKR